MHWKRCIYWLSGLSFVLATIVMVWMDWQEDLMSSVLWRKVFVELGLAFPMILVGLSIILNPEAPLNWLGAHLHWHPPLPSFRVFGGFVLLGGIGGLVTGVLDALIALSIVPNPYAS